ncbi:MAG TPA: SRPBCC family protein [Solirubrobacteraceae bacterium]|jgi:uncharacterized protein YndB with AHSA1/START domain|nr:SRPBCC family protein [Solirubrobacteraceae bacterium]
MPNATGTYQEIDGRPVVRFERTFPHPITEVWAAVTTPARLEKWFPTSVEFDELRPGEPITFRFEEDRFPRMSGEIREVQAPTRLVFTWGEDELTFDLAESDEGDACRLSFSVVLDSAEKAARDAAGWDDCLDMLDEVVSGETPSRPFKSARWQGRYAEYQARGLPATAPIPD